MCAEVWLRKLGNIEMETPICGNGVGRRPDDLNDSAPTWPLNESSSVPPIRSAWYRWCLQLLCWNRRIISAASRVISMSDSIKDIRTYSSPKQNHTIRLQIILEASFKMHTNVNFMKKYLNEHGHHLSLGKCKLYIYHKQSFWLISAVEFAWDYWHSSFAFSFVSQDCDPSKNYSFLINNL